MTFTKIVLMARYCQKHGTQPPDIWSKSTINVFKVNNKEVLGLT